MPGVGSPGSHLARSAVTISGDFRSSSTAWSTSACSSAVDNDSPESETISARSLSWSSEISDCGSGSLSAMMSTSGSKLWPAFPQLATMLLRPRTAPAIALFHPRAIYPSAVATSPLMTDGKNATRSFLFSSSVQGGNVSTYPHARSRSKLLASRQAPKSSLFYTFSKMPDNLPQRVS